jgi:hypothetical protein
MSRFILRNFVQPLIELVLVVDGALIGALRDLLEILHALLDTLYLEECLVKGEKLKRTAQSASEISIIGSGVVHDGRMLMDKIKKVEGKIKKSEGLAPPTHLLTTDPRRS